MTTIKWHRGSDVEDSTPEPGEWYAEVDGHTIARAYIRDGTPAGYWGHYGGDIYGKRTFTATLTEFKQMTADAHKARTPDAAESQPRG